MGCTPCAAKRAREQNKFVWSDDKGNVVVYPSEMAAKAKVDRKGGSYEPVSKT